MNGTEATRKQVHGVKHQDSWRFMRETITVQRKRISGVVQFCH